jgi:hypothetical protein
MKRVYSIVLLLMLQSSLLFAADIHFTATVSKTEVSTTEQFEVTFAINGNGDRFTPPSFTGFLIVAGPNVSTSMSVINGNASSSMEYSYVLIAAKPGSYTIGPASIVVNGKQLSTKPINIKVVKGQAAPQNNNAAAPSQQQQSGPDTRVSMHKAGTDISKSLFIRADVDKKSVFLGEQITLTYKLYTRVAIVGSEPEKLPDLNGFYSQDIKNPDQNVHWRTEVYNGSKFNVANIKQTILFPEHSGDITLDPISFFFVVREAAGASDDDMFGQFFGSYNDVKYRIKSTPVVIHVKPLPLAGKPDGFGGAVGRFSISMGIDKKELKANEALNYKIKISGTGNLKLIKPLGTSFPADFEKYDPKIADTITENANGQSGSRTYTYLLIPRHQGNFTIDPVKFSYFNPTTGKYVSLPTKPFQIKVNKGLSENNVTAYSGADKQDVKLLNKDIRYIKRDDGNISKSGEGFYGSGLYYSLLALGPLLFLGALAYGSWHERANSDMVKVKSRKASKIAAKHLVSAQAQLSAKNSNAFYENVFKGLYGYLSDKLNIAAADLNREKIAAELKSRNLDEPLVNELLDTLDLCDMARYAPVSGISEQQIFDKAKNMINDIEDKI